ncbi:MAG: transporter substrate-binding domain-containing protein [Cyanobacteria bacterium P01_H01_bin.105]
MLRYFGAIIFTALWLSPSTALNESTQFSVSPGSSQSLPEISIRVGTKELPPFVSISPSKSPYGYSADLWNAIADDLEVQTDWVTYKSVSDLLEGIKNGDIDVAIAGISVTAERESQGIDFSYPFYQSGLQLMVPKTKPNVATRANGVLRWTHLRPIVFIFASSTVVGGLIWLVERKHNEGFSGNILNGISQGIWFAVVTLGTFGYGDVTPQKFAGRLIATLWMGLSFFIVADFIASLTVHQLSENTLDLETLSGEAVGALDGTTGEVFLQSQSVNLMIYPTFEAAIRALEAGEIKGLVHDSPALRHFINFNPDSFELAGSLLTNEGYGIAVREDDSELLEAIDQLILDYQQRGFLQELHRKWFDETTLNSTVE